MGKTSTPEGKVKNEVKKILKEHGAWFHMPVQNGMGAPTLDFVGCHKCHFFAIETKAPGKVPTSRQELTMKQMRQAGAFVFVNDGREEHMKELNAWLQFVTDQWESHMGAAAKGVEAAANEEEKEE